MPDERCRHYAQMTQRPTQSPTQSCSYELHRQGGGVIMCRQVPLLRATAAREQRRDTEGGRTEGGAQRGSLDTVAVSSRTFGDVLRRYRLAAGLTQEELATQAG